MKKILLALFILLLLSACSTGSVEIQTPPEAEEKAMTQDPLLITGDVLEPLVLESSIGEVSIYDVLQDAKPQGEEITVIVEASDGVMAEFSYEESDQVMLLHSKEKGWHVSAPNHPPQTGIREIETIVVRAKTLTSEQSSVALLSAEEVLKIWSYGDLFMTPGRSVVIEEGTAVKNDYTTTAYTRRNLIPLSDYVEEGTTLQLYSRDGSVQEILRDGYLEWRGNKADYLSPDLKTRLPDIFGVWGDAPSIRIDHIAKRVLQHIEEEPVMLVLVDAMGWMQYEALRDKLPFLTTADSVERASTTMPSVSSVALASLLTGKLPGDNGVAAEKIRQIEGEDLFDQLTQRGKESIMIEGHVKLMDFSIPQRLHADENHSGTTDDEVFAGAVSAMEEQPDFLFVHFHGYDDLAHTYGPYSQEAVDGLVQIDEYVRDLYAGFHGRLIVIADHGQHDIQGDKLGEHGEFLPSDMIIPVLEWTR